jgi:hypothetical protein
MWRRLTQSLAHDRTASRVPTFLRMLEASARGSKSGAIDRGRHSVMLTEQRDPTRNKAATRR